MRHRIGRIADACIDLSKHGPLKPADQRGIDEVGQRGNPACMRPTGTHPVAIDGRYKKRAAPRLRRALGTTPTHSATAPATRLTRRRRLPW